LNVNAKKWVKCPTSIILLIIIVAISPHPLVLSNSLLFLRAHTGPKKKKKKKKESHEKKSGKKNFCALVVIMQLRMLCMQDGVGFFAHGQFVLCCCCFFHGATNRRERKRIEVGRLGWEWGPPGVAGGKGAR
jgi:hypothetical protein